MKIYGLADCNSFFASCEKVFHPEWNDRPVVVLSNNDGCIVARSYEAKPLVPMGAPYFQVKNILKSNNAVVRSSNFSLYGDMSRRVMRTLRRWTADLEIYSIDEAFLDLTGRFLGDLRKGRSIDAAVAALAAEIVETVPRWTGIPVSFGVGPTKTLAKAANKIAKGRKSRQCSILDEKERTALLAELEIADLWGVGRRLAPRFRRLGFRTAADLAAADPLWIRRNFSIMQEMTVRELNGCDCFDLETVPDPPKSVRASRSFGTPVTRLETIQNAVASFVAEAARRLRKSDCVASAVVVQLDTNRFRADQTQSHVALTAGLDTPTSDTPTLLAAALDAAARLFRPDVEYKRAMILLIGIVERENAFRQRTFFDSPTDERERKSREKLMSAVDHLNQSLGSGRIFYAAEGIDPVWRPSSEFVSPSYTTRWSDIPVVKAK